MIKHRLRRRFPLLVAMLGVLTVIPFINPGPQKCWILSFGMEKKMYHFLSTIQESVKELIIY